MIGFILRVVLVILIVLITIIVFKNKKMDVARKKVTIVVSYCLIVMMLLGISFKLEDRITYFETPRDAFEYSRKGEIENIIYGKNSCMIVYSISAFKVETLILESTENGYKLPSSFQTKIVTNTLGEKINLMVSSLSGTDDYYFCGQTHTKDKEIVVTDNLGNSLDHMVYDNVNAGINIVLVYGYIEDVSEDYFVWFNGEKTTVNLENAK